MRIVHTADWHLGKLLYGVHLTAEQARFFETEFCPLLRDLRPDLLVVAGDVFDRSVPPAEAVQLLSEILTRLHAEGIRVLLLPGNHDSRERLAFGRDLLSRLGIHLVTGEDLLFSPLDLGDIRVYGVPHLPPLVLREVLESRGLLPAEFSGGFGDLWRVLLQGIPSGKERRILVAHILVEGGEREETGEELWVGGEEALPAEIFASLDLVLLGHLHRPQQPAPNIFYAGSPYPLSFSEKVIPRGVWMFEFSGEGGLSREFISLSSWELRVLRGTFAELLRGPGYPGYVKVILEDETPIPQAFERLKKVFPGLLALETPALRGLTGEIRRIEKGDLHDPLRLFRLFLQEIEGRPPTAEEEGLLREALSRLAST